MKAASDFSHVTFISAGAGSGKTYRLTEELERALVDHRIDPAGVIGTTFTVKAAGELKDRVRERLIGSGRPQLAEQMSQALIGTVHSVCERLLGRFAFELGISPQQNVLGVEDHRLFHQALDEVLSLDDVRTMNGLAVRLGIATWQNDVKRVADRARENAVGPTALVAMGVTSADALLAFFPAPNAAEYTRLLLQTIADAMAAIDLASDTTKGTARYVEYLRAAKAQLRRDDCPWSVWIKLGAEKATKASEPIAARVREAAQRYATNADFHGDVRAYIEGTYAIAAATLERFRDLKTQRGLIDFTDMEQRMLDALDNAAVQERLDDELELLLVDEFQDTNPMQLALFVKLAQLADRVIFVGDVKQAIYAFRGCDPDLVFRTLDGLATHDASTDRLEWSWRSRPALVEYVNAVFVDAFAKDGIAPEQIRLAAKRPERIVEPVITLWLSEGNKPQQFPAIANAIAALVAGAVQVVDPESGEPRAVRYGDIAILARTNANVEAQALALKAARVPMKMTLRGLLEVPEVCLARACLRRLIDATDTLATAEIVVLADCALPDVWLGERLRAVAEGGQRQWLETAHPIVKRLAELRADAAFQSPVETIVRVLNDVGIREIAAAWGPDAIKAAQRQRNLDAFLNLAVEYEKYCTTMHEAATLTGFLFWVLDPHSPDLDLQPTVTTGDAVHVLTYHKAKGLEWPVVIATDFDAENRSSLWDARVLLTSEFDVNAPLANRIIRFWPRIFGERRKGIAILETIETSAEALDCERKNASEQRRLAYVGITRARDLLIVALTDKATKGGAWLETFATLRVLPTGEELQLPNGVIVPSRAMLVASDGAPPAPMPYAPTWFVTRDRATSRPPRELLSPSQAEPVVDAVVGRTVELGERVSITGADMTLIGNALHAVIAAELVNPGRPDAVARAEAILGGYAVAAYIDAPAAVRCAQRFLAFVMTHFEPLRIHVEYPIQHVLPNGQRVRGWVDVLLQTSAGCVVIDHKSSPRPRSEWHQEALSHSGQLQGYRRALTAAGEPVCACAIHFPISGGLVFVEGL